MIKRYIAARAASQPDPSPYASSSYRSVRYPSVLVLGVVPSLTWAVARCLRRVGGAPVVLGWHGWAPMALTRDCRRYVRWSGLRRNGEGLDGSVLGQVRRLCAGGDIDAVVGADYDTALLLADPVHRQGLPACAVPAASTISTFNDKWNLARLLEALELPYPDSRRIANAEELLATTLSFPIITKPLDLWASVGFEIHRSREALAARLARGALKSEFPLIAQAYVPGWDVGASFLAQRGRLVACSVFRHQQRGVRTFYDSARVRGYLESFVAASHYSGVGHLDLRYDPSRDRYFILELNPRFWASLLYAAQAGLNYPDLLLRLDGREPGPVLTPRPGSVRLPMYERTMTLATRWFGAAYERTTGARL
jgi:predicted ATP-grasp superfamily ATP-dependent carboligase